MVSTEGMIARELRNAADRYIDLNDLRPFIEKTIESRVLSSSSISAASLPNGG